MSAIDAPSSEKSEVLVDARSYVSVVLAIDEFFFPLLRRVILEKERRKYLNPNRDLFSLLSLISSKLPARDRVRGLNDRLIIDMLDRVDFLDTLGV